MLLYKKLLLMTFGTTLVHYIRYPILCLIVHCAIEVYGRHGRTRVSAVILNLGARHWRVVLLKLRPLCS